MELPNALSRQDVENLNLFVWRAESALKLVGGAGEEVQPGTIGLLIFDGTDAWSGAPVAGRG